LSGLRKSSTLVIESNNEQKNEIMKNLKSPIILFATLFAISLNAQTPGKYVSTKTHVKFFSTTPVEDIEAHNYATVGTIAPSSGEVIFSVPIQSFEFEKAMMQQHFNNEHFLESSVFPKAKFKGTITNLDEIDFTKNGEYKAKIEGDMTIKDKTNPINETGTIKVSGQVLTIDSSFDIILADYGITFNDSEMVSTKIGKSIEITINGEYEAE
jgi:polyisoprenoid-binding protein YceI